jgi:hypothetical protein
VATRDVLVGIFADHLARTLIDHLDQAVLAKAFRGELVPQDPNDEPASVLLERIRAERAAGLSKKALNVKRDRHARNSSPDSKAGILRANRQQTKAH